MTNRVMFCVTLFGAAYRSPLTALRSPLTAQDTVKGKAVYAKWCAGCHGDTGAGDGPAAAAMVPRPRNFTGAVYKIRTTASGQLPTDADLMRAIDEGLRAGAVGGCRAPGRARRHQDLLGVLRRREPARRALELRQGAEWGSERAGGEDGPLVLRFDRMPQGPRGSRAGRRPFGVVLE